MRTTSSHSCCRYTRKQSSLKSPNSILSMHDSSTLERPSKQTSEDSSIQDDAHLSPLIEAKHEISLSFSLP